jgi:ribose transport system ATP-binding protein
VLLLDEITASLPADLSERIYAMVRHWRDRGNAVIFISHRMAEVADLCDRATVLRDGVTVGVTERAHGSEERIVALMLGAETAGASAPSASKLSGPRATPRDRQAALEVRALARSPLLNDVSFKLYAGEVLGVAALEGQGQEELFDCIAGNRRYDEGTILAHGKELKLRHPADAIREGIVLVPANRVLALLQQRSIRENIALPAFGGLSSWGPIGMRRERARVASATERLQIDTRASELSRLSGGNQQKVVIARWLATGFNTLLCFDPTRGIDVGTKRQIYALVRQLAAAGSAVLLFTSELQEIALACDRAIVLFGGRMVAEMPVDEADEATLLRAAHGLAPQAQATS